MINENLIKEDFYMAVNEQWLKTAKIPDDRDATGAFHELSENMEKLLLNEMEELSASKADLNSDKLVQMVKFYDLARDFKTRDEFGAEPLMPYIAKIQALNNYDDLNKLLETWILYGFELPFSCYVSENMADTSMYSLYLNKAELILPDTSYYVDDNLNKAKLLDIYSNMAQKLLEYANIEDAAEIVRFALVFDELLVPHCKSAEELADYTRAYNPKSLEEVQGYLKKFDIKALFKSLVNCDVDEIIVEEPKYFEALDSILSIQNFKYLKAWLLVKLIVDCTEILSEEMRQIGSVYSLALSGKLELESPQKTAFKLATGYFDHVMGDYYGRKYFGEAAKADVKDMVKSMIEVYKKRLGKLEWLSLPTREKAIDKLESMDILVGYPDKIESVYDKLQVKQYGNYEFFYNVLEFSSIHARNSFTKFGKPVDKTLWSMPAHMVNAYFHPLNNLICFPAAILQDPFYSIELSSSANFGAIGAVIAHEISHAFDNNGAKFDKFGNLNNWWSEEDFDAFNQRAQKMIDRWDKIPYGNGVVNGKLTVSENIADAGGISCALEAAKAREDVDLRAFFISWARIWRNKTRPETIELQLNTDVHAPTTLRANIPMQNLDEFYEVFSITPSDKMYLDHQKRVNIW